ncbi:DUF4224 domain-containing protein [Cupriavidus gilardii]|uniref:DUF4224 domain-containing protein n=1 Tax=Cupriavidus gilardii TaxID=82541 RepID=UPI002B2CAFC1|nr:DUF4224 domain-containing protein [Cupriavidus gilardii]
MKGAAARIIEATRKQWEKEMTVLTNNELKELTGGLVQGAAQRRWIKRQLGIDAPTKIDGHPMITWEQVNRGHVKSGQRRGEPRWSVAA